MSGSPMSTPPWESRWPHVISEPTPPPGWQPPEMPPPWLREARHIKSPPENVHRLPINCPSWGCGSPPIKPLPPSTINEILKEVKEAEKHGEMPIAVEPRGIIAIPKPTSTEVKPSTEHEKLGKLGLKHAPQEEKQSSPQHLWIGWKIEPEMEKYIKEFTEAFEHGRHVHRPPIELPMMGGVLAPIPGAPAPGAPVTILPPQGAGNQQQLTA